MAGGLKASGHHYGYFGLQLVIVQGLAGGWVNSRQQMGCTWGEQHQPEQKTTEKACSKTMSESQSELQNQQERTAAPISVAH
jgi:hypothetical protein